MNIIPKLRIRSLPFEDKLIKDTFRKNQLVLGPHISIFENGLAACFDFKYVNSTSSGFAALFLALKSLKLVDAKVVVPSVSTCQAITNAVLANGFEIVFCEISPNHLSLDEEALEAIFHEKQIDVIIAPSHFGIPAPIDAYKKYGVPVIEDACQAFFTRTTIKSTADIMVLSFYPTKQFNCIEGGAILHNNFEKALFIEDLKYYDHQTYFDGITRYNFKMANLHAAFGCMLLGKLEVERNRLMRKRNFFIKGINQKKLLIAAQCGEGVIPWRFMIKSENVKLFEVLSQANIQSDKEMIELSSSNLKVSCQNWFDNYQSIPFYSFLNQQDQKFIIQKINGIEF